MKRLVYFIFISFIIISSVLSDTISINVDTTNITVDSAVTVDTVLFNIQGQLSNTIQVTDSTNFERRLIQTPTKALLKSMLIPGWGQFGNKKPFKALLFAGMDTWMILSAVHHGKKADDLFNQFESTDDLDLRRQYYSMYLSSKDKRNKFTWFAVIISFISMFDAYVDAHLSGYPEVDSNTDAFSLDIIQDNNSGPLVQLSYHF